MPKMTVKSQKKGGKNAKIIPKQRMKGKTRQREGKNYAKNWHYTTF